MKFESVTITITSRCGPMKKSDWNIHLSSLNSVVTKIKKKEWN